jgi:hypothetical protein
MAKANSSFIQKALGLFNLHADGGGTYEGSNSGRIMPDTPLLKGAKHPHLTLPNYTPLQQIWTWFLNEMYDTSESLRNRKTRYEDLDFACKQNSLIQASVSLFADEATQCDISGTPVRIKNGAVKKVQ